jgi:hypothetical protein
MGWGSSEFGLSAWGVGGAGSGSIYLEAALATTERTVQGRFTGNVRALSALGTGDALNPASWTVQRLDTLAYLTVLTVRVVLADNVFELYTLQKLGGPMVVHRLANVGILDFAGAPTVAPLTADFYGLEAFVSPPDQRGPRDLLNHPHSGTAISGVLRATSGGDYATHAGAEMVRKLVIRRLTTSPHSFFHLDKNYGLGIKDKQPLPVNDLTKLKVEVERQIEREPDVDSARASVSLNRQGILTITAQVKMKNNQVVPVEFSVPTAAVEL